MLRVVTFGVRGQPLCGTRLATRPGWTASPTRPAWSVLRPVLLVALSLHPAAATGQEADCSLVRVGGHTRSMRSAFASGPATYRHYASGGVDYRCSDGTRVLADSAIVYESDNQVQLYGNVLFEDAETELLADSAFYFSNLRRLHAWTNVRVTDRIGGAVIRGEFLTYDQASEFRALDRITVEGGEPHATFFVARRQAALPEEESGTDPAEAAEPLEPDSGQVRTDPPEADSGQARTDPPEPDTGQVRTDPPEPDSGQAEDSLTADEVSETRAEAADTIPPVPWEVDADAFSLEGRRHFRAVGQVVITRDSLTAFGDSLQYDQEVGEMVVTGGARFEGQDYTLTGMSISVTPSGPRSEEVLARVDAQLSGKQVDMTAPAIRLFVEGGIVGRLVALPAAPPLPGGNADFDASGLSPGDAERVRALVQEDPQDAESPPPEDSLPRPAVVAQDFHLTGDSIEVLSPDQRLDRVIAVGRARAEGTGQDSLRVLDLPDAARRDWMTGDTIVARFGSGESSDSTAAAVPTPADTLRQLETLTATGNARSFYRVFPSDTAEVGTDRRPALHLVNGARITIHLERQEVVRMDVEGETEGWHFDPRPAAADSSVADTTQASADSAAASAAATPPDTGRAPSGPALPAAPHATPVASCGIDSAPSAAAAIPARARRSRIALGTSRLIGRRHRIGAAKR